MPVTVQLRSVISDASLKMAPANSLAVFPVIRQFMRMVLEPSLFEMAPPLPKLAPFPLNIVLTISGEAFSL
ncbi:hypothetical protein D3C87_1641720 [compost metagenome]